MLKYQRLLRYELKTILSDPFYLVMLFYPFLMLFVCAYLLPAILAKTTLPTSSAHATTLLIGFIVLISVGGFMMGALLGFSFLENKDENTLINIAASPLSVKGYTLFKSAYSYCLSLLANLVMLGGLKLFASDAYTLSYGGEIVRLLDKISYGQIILFALVASFIVPIVALLLASIANNKMEGFAMIKTGGLLIMLPLLLLLPGLQDGKQYILGLIPHFWATKGLLSLVLPTTQAVNLDFGLYLGVGVVYQLLLGYGLLRLFIKKTS